MHPSRVQGNLMPKSTQPSVFCCESLRELYRLQPNAQKSISFRALTLREESGGLSNCPCAIFFFFGTRKYFSAFFAGFSLRAPANHPPHFLCHFKCLGRGVVWKSKITPANQWILFMNRAPGLLPRVAACAHTSGGGCRGGGGVQTEQTHKSHAGLHIENSLNRSH